MKILAKTYAMMVTISLMLVAGGAMAGNGINERMDQLADRIEVVNIEDQRLTDGNFADGKLTLYTEDMDGDSRRAVEVDMSDAVRDVHTSISSYVVEEYDDTELRAGLASATAIGGLEFYDVGAGETSWAFGFGGQYNGGDDAVAAGIRIGVTDTFGINASIGTSFDGVGTSYAIGASGKF